MGMWRGGFSRSAKGRGKAFEVSEEMSRDLPEVTKISWGHIWEVF